MSRTPPEANTEYSRGGAVSGGPSRPPGHGESAVSGRSRDASAPLAVGVFAIALLGSLVLILAEFTTLFQVHMSGVSQPIRTVSGGSHHSYAMALIGVCAAILAVAVWRAGSRPALLGLGLLGVAALLIALLVDLSHATSSGLIVTASHDVEGKSTPSAGFFIETLGALLLVIASVSGFLLSEPPTRTSRRPASAPRP